MWPGDGPDHDEVEGDDQDRPDRVVGQPSEVGQDADRCDDDGDGAGPGVAEELSHISGALRTSVLEELRGVRVVTQSQETVLQGPVADQADLIRMINRLQGLGVEPRGIRQLGDDATDPSGFPRPAPRQGRRCGGLRDPGSRPVRARGGLDLPRCALPRSSFRPCSAAPSPTPKNCSP